VLPGERPRESHDEDGGFYGRDGDVLGRIALAFRARVAKLTFVLMANWLNQGRSNPRVRLAALIFSLFAAGCFGPPPFMPPVYSAPGRGYVPPVYDYRGYGRPVVVENRTALGGYAPGRDVWADSVRGRASYVGHRPGVYQR
jgi:hypothetical protein